MRKQEIAVVKCAVKRSIRAGSVEVGYKFLEEWAEKWKETCDIKNVMKCFKAWEKQATI